MSSSSSSSPPSPTLDDVAATEISNEHNSAQQSLLNSVEWLEKELLSGIIIDNQTPSTARPNSNNELDFHDDESKFTNHGKTVSHIPDPTTRLSEQRNQTSDKDYASSTFIDNSPVSEAKQKAAQENSQAEQESSSERNEKQDEGTSEKNVQAKQQKSATVSVEEDNSGKENPGANENLVTWSAEKNYVNEKDVTKVTNASPLAASKGVEKASPNKRLLQKAQEGGKRQTISSGHQ